MENARMDKFPAGHPRRGAILLLVLVFVALIASLLAAVQHAVTSDARGAKAFADSLRAEELGRAAVDLLAGQILSSDLTGQRNGSFTAFIDGAEVHVVYLSESARLDANLAPPNLIGGLARASGLEPNDAGALAERIVQLRQTNDAKAMEDIDAIAAAWDLPPDVFATMRPFLTVTNGSAKIDPLIADPLLVAALFGGEGPASEMFLARRAEGFATEQEARAALPSELHDAVTFAPGATCRANVRVRLTDGFQRRFEFILAMPKPSDDRIDAIAWRMIP